MWLIRLSGGYFVHRHTAKENASFLWVVETGTKFHHRAFPTTRKAYKSRQGVFGERDGYVVQHFLVLIGKRYVLKPNVACHRGLPFSFHFRLVHQGKDTSSCNGKVSELCEIGQGGSQWVEHTGTDYEKQHEHKYGKLASQQQVCSAQHHINEAKASTGITTAPINWGRW